MSAIPDSYKDILHTVAIRFKLKQWQYKLQNFEAVGQNYFGILIPVVLSGYSENDEEEHLHLVMKIAPDDERYRVSGAMSLMFAREIYFYSVIFKKYKELCEKFGIQFVAPICYYASGVYCKEAIVMEDMCYKGYQAFTDSLFLDSDLVVIALKSIAKLHALSFIMKVQYVQQYREAKDVCLPLTEKTNKRYIDILKDRLIKAIYTFEGTEYASLLQSLKENCQKHIEAVADMVQQTCICHGDIWKENIMFKYVDGRPVSACLIDYQTARVSSPAFDVLYLIASSTNATLRGTHYFEFLDTYFSALKQSLSQAGLNYEDIYPRDAFNKDLKTVASACFIVANTALWLYHGLQQEGHVQSKIVLSTEEQKAEAVKRYKSVICDIINDFKSYDYFE